MDTKYVLSYFAKAVIRASKSYNSYIKGGVDLEYDPNEYLEVLTPIFDEKADGAYGSRFITVKPHRVLYFWYSVGNKLLTLMDMEACYKAFNLKAIDYLKDRLTA